MQTGGKELTDMDSSEPENLKPEEQKSSQTPEDMKDESKGQSIVTYTYTHTHTQVKVNTNYKTR